MSYPNGPPMGFGFGGFPPFMRPGMPMPMGMMPPRGRMMGHSRHQPGGVTAQAPPRLNANAAGYKANEDITPQSTTVFVGNICEAAPDEMVKQLLQRCGTVLSWKRVQGASGKLQAFGFCEYDEPGATLRCIRLLNDWGIGERSLVVKVDAKTQTCLDEYKSKRWGSGDKSGGGGKEQNGVDDIQFDEGTLREDRVCMAGIDAIMREYDLKGSAKPKELSANVADKVNAMKQDPTPQSYEFDKSLKEAGIENTVKEADIKEQIIHFRTVAARKTHVPDADADAQLQRAIEQREREDASKSGGGDAAAPSSDNRSETATESEKERSKSRGHEYDRDRSHRSRERERGEYRNDRDSDMHHRGGGGGDHRGSDRHRGGNDRGGGDRRDRDRHRQARDRDYTRGHRHESDGVAGVDLIDAEDREAAMEKARKEKRIRDKEMSYQSRLRNWEVQETRHANEYERHDKTESDRIRELRKEASRLREFLEDYDDQRDDSKFYKSHALSRRQKEREREMDSDARDRRKEKQEIDDVRRQLTERGDPDIEARVGALEKECDEHLLPRLDLDALAKHFPPEPVSVAVPEPERGVPIDGSSSFRSTMVAADANTISPSSRNLMQAQEALMGHRSSSSSSSKHQHKSHHQTAAQHQPIAPPEQIVPSSADHVHVQQHYQEEAYHQQQRQRSPPPLPVAQQPPQQQQSEYQLPQHNHHKPIPAPFGEPPSPVDESESPSYPGGGGSSSQAAQQQPQQLLSRVAAADAASSNSNQGSPVAGGKRKPTVADVFNEDAEAESEEAKKRKLVPLKYTVSESVAPMSDAPRTAEERKHFVKKLIERIPTTKQELFDYELDWSCIDKDLMEKRIRPWINKKMVEYIGEEEPSLSQFICDKIMNRASPNSLLDDVTMVLDEEANVFVVKMWRLLIYETEAKKLGLVK